MTEQFGQHGDDATNDETQHPLDLTDFGFEHRQVGSKG
jgi:hypothetical protein